MPPNTKSDTNANPMNSRNDKLKTKLNITTGTNTNNITQPSLTSIRLPCMIRNQALVFLMLIINLSKLLRGSGMSWIRAGL
jgi:hypothetical protein